MDDYRYGTPSLAEWRGLWLASPAVSPHSREEYDDACGALSSRLRVHLQIPLGEYPAYFRGDDYGDRTQYLDIGNPDILTADLVLAVQSWLREDTLRLSRVYVITDGEDDNLMIYPYAIMGVNGECSGRLREYVDALVQRMKQRRGFSS